MIGTTLGPYRILGKLGAGGMGEVYRARDTKLARDVALKILPESFAADPDRLMRFEREARTLAALNHPNIAAIYGLEDRALVMELVEGEDLSERIARGAVPVDEALGIARQVAGALEAAHEAGVVHRDLKPANIKVRPDGTVKVLDFGLAKAMDPAGSSSVQENAAQSPTMTSPALTQAGIILGTAAYMSPEQARGKTVDKRADIWAFGVVLFEMLGGRRAFDGPEVTDVLAAVIRDTPSLDALPAGTPVRIRRLLRRCLEKDPTRRLRDIGDARLEIEADEPEPVPAASSSASAPRPLWRRALPWVTATVAVVLAGFAGARLSAPEVVEPVRVRLQWPTDTRSFYPPAVSWEGDLVAYQSEDGLKVRRLDSTAVRTLEGTEDARYIAWLPDTSAIVYLDRQANELRKVTLADGAIETVTSLNEGVLGGLFVSASGDVLFFDDVTSGPKIVSLTGGAVRTPLSLEEGTYAFPLGFLAGGNSFLYSVSDLSSRKVTLYVASIDGSTTREIPALTALAQQTLESSGLYFIPSGHVVFTVGETLFQQPVDPVSLAPTGDPLPLVGLNPEQVAFSADGRVMAWTAIPEWRQAMRTLSWIDSRGRVIDVGGPDRIRDVALAPDGRRAVASISDEEGERRADLWLIDLERPSLRRRLTTTPDRDELAPVWSADGSAVGAVSSTNQIGSSRLVRVSATGAGGVEVLSELSRTVFASSFAWTSDAQRLLTQLLDIELFDRASTLRIFEAGSTAEPVNYLETRFGEGEPRLSPDDEWVALVSNQSGRDEIYLDRFPTPAGLIPVSGGPGDSPRWSADGRELYYIADDRLMAVSVTPGGDPIVGSPRVVADLPERTRTCDPAPDGRFLCMTLVPEDPDDAADEEPATINVLVNPFRGGGS